jgi:hypothetical protein
MFFLSIYKKVMKFFIHPHEGYEVANKPIYEHKVMFDDWLKDIAY